MKDEHDQKTKARLSRRDFLKASGALLAASAGGVTIAHEPTAPHTPGPPLAPSFPVVSQYPGTPSEEVPFAPERPPTGVLHFFTPHEARTVEAIAARIFPGDEDDPGAREAGIVVYIDYALSQGHGFNEPIYRFPPFAQGYKGDEPPQEEDRYGVIWVEEDELERYGYQSILTPRDMFRKGLAALDRYANDEHEGDFAELFEDEQDEVLMALEDGEAEGFHDPSGEDFFEIVREFVVQGMFSDPQYGGNHNMVGWKLLNYPGAQRAYTQMDMMTEGHRFEPQPMAELDHMHPGQPANEHVILPVFEEEERRR